MNLKTKLTLQIIIVSSLCVSAACAFELYRFKQKKQSSIEHQVEAIAKQLNFQLLRIKTGFDHADRFPDLDLWQQTHTDSGLCIHYQADHVLKVKNICHGIAVTELTFPVWFASLYRLFLNPEVNVSKPILFNHQRYGSVTVSNDADQIINESWNVVKLLLELSSITSLSVCFLVYLTFNRTLKPAGIIVSGLEKMCAGELDTRLPNFEINEWQQTAHSINRLASSQTKLLAERSRLSLRLMSLQEQERIALAQELHDELGQNLTAVNAATSGLIITIRNQCPSLTSEAVYIAQIHRRIMNAMSNLLVKLRTNEIEDLGLTTALESLVAEWACLSKGKINFELNIDDSCHNLPDSISLSLYRIIQECLTNIIKHSTASSAKINLNLDHETLWLNVEDDGSLTKLPTDFKNRFGILGIRERVMALDGKVNLTVKKEGGLVVSIKIPVRHFSLDKPCPTQ